ncbi:MAG: hypothetical protein AAF501_15600 [Pseudomonadota bacterium]
MRQRIEDTVHMTRQVREENWSPNFSAILPMTGRFTLRMDDLFEALGTILGDNGPEVRADPLEAATDQTSRSWLRFGKPAPEAHLFSIGGIRMLVSHEHGSFEEESGFYRFINPNLWRSGAHDAAGHSSFVTVLEMSDAPFPHPDDVFDRAVAVTATAAAIAELHPILAALWQPAENALPPALFNSAIEDLKAEIPPLLLWTRWNLLPGDSEEQQPGLTTRGLSPLIGREIIAPPSDMSMEHMLENVFRLASRMINWDNPPVDGSVIGRAAPCRLRFRRRSIYSDDPYYELIPTGETA